MSLGIDLVAAGLSLTIGITAIVKTLSDLLKKNKHKRTIKIISGGKRIEIPDSTSADVIEILIDRLKEIDDIEVELKKPSVKNENGFALSEIFLYLVPGVIALLFSGTFIYLILTHQDVENYSTPEELSSVLKMIVGYFFGVGAATASNKGKSLTPEDIEKLTNG